MSKFLSETGFTSVEYSTFFNSYRVPYGKELLYRDILHWGTQVRVHETSTDPDPQIKFRVFVKTSDLLFKIIY